MSWLCSAHGLFKTLKLVKWYDVQNQVLHYETLFKNSVKARVDSQTTEAFTFTFNNTPLIFWLASQEHIWSKEKCQLLVLTKNLSEEII